jgi:DNA-binding MarR family transcriptional regulator
MAQKLLRSEEFILALLTILSNKLASSASNTYRTSFGVNATECRVILTLAVQPGISAQRISQIIAFDKGLISRTVRSLEKQRYISVSPDENGGRRTKLALTRSGLDLNNRIAKAALRRENLLLSGFTKTEIHLIRKFLQRMLGNMDRVSAYKPQETPGT